MAIATGQSLVPDAVRPPSSTYKAPSSFPILITLPLIVGITCNHIIFPPQPSTADSLPSLRDNFMKATRNW